jgi:hypothetical protein
MSTGSGQSVTAGPPSPWAGSMSTKPRNSSAADALIPLTRCACLMIVRYRANRSGSIGGIRSALTTGMQSYPTTPTVFPECSARLASVEQRCGAGTSGRTTVLRHGTRTRRELRTRGGSPAGPRHARTRPVSTASRRRMASVGVHATGVTSWSRCQRGSVERTTRWMPVLRSCRALKSTSTTTASVSTSSCTRRSLHRAAPSVLSSSQAAASAGAAVVTRRRADRTWESVGNDPVSPTSSSQVVDVPSAAAAASTRVARSVPTSAACRPVAAGASGPRTSATVRSRPASAAVTRSGSVVGAGGVVRFTGAPASGPAAAAW